MHPRVQNKLFDELQQVFQSKSEEVTEEKIESCVYLDLVVKEAMRVWPSIPFLVRTLNEEVDFGIYLIKSSCPLLFILQFEQEIALYPVV